MLPQFRLIYSFFEIYELEISSFTLYNSKIKLCFKILFTVIKLGQKRTTLMRLCQKSVIIRRNIEENKKL